MAMILMWECLLVWSYVCAETSLQWRMDIFRLESGGRSLLDKSVELLVVLVNYTYIRVQG